jgi:hypothetical protein
MANPPTNIYVDPSKQTRTSCTITSSSTTATVTQNGHGYSNSDTVKIQGETGNPTEFNGNHVISNVTTNTYDYTISDLSGASGTGTIVASKLNLSGDDGTTDALAWADLQYAFEQETQTASHGDRFNVKYDASQTEVLTKSLDLSSYGTPTYNTPLIIQGYASTSEDGTQGQIDCGGFTLFSTTNYQGVGVLDMECHNGPATGYLVELGTYSTASNVYVHDSDGGGIKLGSESQMFFCQGFDLGTSGYYGFSIGQYAIVFGCWYKQGASRVVDRAISASRGSSMVNNMISISAGSYGCYHAEREVRSIGNTIIGNQGGTGGTNAGIYVPSSTTGMGWAAVNNYIEGFNGTGGSGIEVAVNSTSVAVYGGNAFFNNTANETISDEHKHDLGGNESYTTTGGVALSGDNTWALRNTYYAPVDKDNMLTGAYPEAL